MAFLVVDNSKRMSRRPTVRARAAPVSARQQPAGSVFGCTPIRSARYPLLMEAPSSKVAVQWALAFLGCMRLLVTRPCVVLDIDGTVLLNGNEGSTRCVLPFHSLVRACEAHSIAVYCVTARPDEPENRAYTERQLEKCGIRPVAALYMRSPNASYQAYKHKARQDIMRKGNSILLTVGDQFADISVTEAPEEIADSKIYVGQMGDNMQFGIKLASEFA